MIDDREWAVTTKRMSELVERFEEPAFNPEEVRNHTDSDHPRLCVLCDRLDGNRSMASYHADLASLIINSNYCCGHRVWDTVDSLMRTVCKYNHSYMLGNGRFTANVKVTLNEDYLDSVLLAQRPSSSEIGKEAWHAMTMRMIGKADEVDQQIRGAVTDTDGMRFSDIMLYIMPLLFFNKDIEELVFLEDVYDMLTTLGAGVRNTTYHQGMLDPAPFDLLREYGTSFVKPFIEVGLERMRNKDKDTVMAC